MSEWKRKSSSNPNPYCSEVARGAHGNKSETRILSDMGAEQVIASGALDGLKSDGLLSVGEYNFRIECKATSKKSMGVKYEWLKKIRTEAMSTGKTPILTISFVRLDGQSKPAGDWVMIPAGIFNEVFNND